MKTDVFTFAKFGGGRRNLPSAELCKTILRIAKFGGRRRILLNPQSAEIGGRLQFPSAKFGGRRRILLNPQSAEIPSLKREG